MPARRLTLALPAGDPRSARIWAFLAALNPEADSSAELRALICAALDQAARMTSIEAKLDALLARGVAAVPSAEPPSDPAIIDPALLDRMLNFDLGEA